MKLIGIILLLFIYINLLQFSNGAVQVKDISYDKNARFRYNNNDGGICVYLNVYVLVHSTVLSASPSFNLAGSPPSGNFSSNSRLTNETSAVYQIDYRVGTTGTFQVPIIGTYDGISATQPSLITFTCLQVAESDIEFDSFELATSVNVFGTIGFFVKLKNLQYPFEDTKTGGNNGNHQYMGNSIYYFTQTISLTLEQPAIIFFDGTISATPLNYYLSDNIEVIYDYHLYTKPNQVELMGDLVAPAFTFVSNSTYYKPPFLGELQGGSPFYNMRLISTNGPLKTYLGYYDYRNYIGVSAEYKLKSQSANSYVQRKYETLTVTDITFDPIPRVGSIQASNVDTYVVQYVSSSTYNYSPIYIRYRGTKMFQFPFGFAVGSNVGGYTWEVSVKIPISAPVDETLYVGTDTTVAHFKENHTGFNKSIPSPTYPSVSLLPTFSNHEFIYLYDFMYILKINITSFIPIYKIQINEMVFNYAESISIKSQFNEGGIFEFPLNLLVQKILITVNDYSIGVSSGYYSIDNLTPFILPSFFDEIFNYLDIKNVSLLNQVVNVTNQKVGNILYFSYVGLDKNTPIGLLLNGPSYSNEEAPTSLGAHLFDKLWPAKWNSDIGMFQVEFWLPKNSQPGKIPYALFFKNDRWIPNSKMGDAAQLTVISNNADLYGPIFSKIEKIPLTNPITGDTIIGWNLRIVDPVNGFKNGTIRVRGSIDGSTYNFKIADSTTSNIFSLQYTVEINVVSPCVAQDYIITDVLLYDTEENNSTFSIYSLHKSIEQSSLYNPFINYMNDSTINRISVVCNSVSIDMSPPVISDLKIDTVSLDISSAVNRRLNISYIVGDSNTGLKKDHYPTVYLSALNLDTIECIPDRVTKIDQFSSEYYCNVVIPLGFGYPLISISIYGLINNGGLFSGYSTVGLQVLGMTKTTITTTMTMDIPFIKSSSKISTNGGKLWLIGKGLKNVKSANLVSRASMVTVTLDIDEFVGYSALLVSIPPISTPFTITLIGDLTNSNDFTIIPYTPVLSVVTPTPSTTPVPTNKPQQCLGTPECGGIDKGYCSLTGCICKSPWIGIDCSSKVIIVPPPLTNPSNPSTEIPIVDGTDNSNNNNTPNYIFKSLISIVSLREFDFQNKMIKNHTFDKWILTPIDELTSNYFTNISVVSGVDGSKSISNITVKLQWFKQETNITFANEQLIMQASSMKYTIELSEYKFENQLNTLQFVMMASLQSTQTSDICSKSEFGETSTGDNSNYIKIQIDNKSLYGRFIKRAIVDSMISSVNNIPLDSSFNPIKEASTLQSYIGINVPNFKSTIIIDPDFSVLLDNESASNNDNDSICNISKSALTTSQLIGIIVGSGVIFIAIVGVALFLFIRNRKHTLLLLKIKEIKMFKSK